MRIVVLFNLRPEVTPDAYEAWARSTDIPAVRSLGSVTRFDVLRATGLLGSDGTPPFAYVELIDVGDDAGFGADVGTPQMQRIAGEFRKYADDPLFILLQDIMDPS